MRQLLPTASDEVETFEAIQRERRTHTDGRPWVLTNLVVGLDGGIEIDGRSRPLSSDADRALFRALRSIADVVLVGASTARLERYRLPGVVDGSAEVSGRVPTLCVVSGSLEFDADLPFLNHRLSDEQAWPVVMTGNTADPQRIRDLQGRAHVIAFETADVEAPALVQELARRGATTILCEGGPRLLAQLGNDGLIDEWNLSIAPLLTGGDAARLSVAGSRTSSPLHLDRLFVHDDHLFARYLQSRGGV